MKKNILIVDDSELNNELLFQLISQFSNENNLDINILTALNGKNAVNICSDNQIDLIFMDIMMPLMDGSEATKIIKRLHPQIMIIAVSALGDEKEQKKMLLKGAEDYITKPVIASVFKSRLNNYMQIIEHKNHISTIAKAQNIITSKVYNYKMDFTISSEEDLSEFWEAMLIRFNFQQQIGELNEMVRFLYSLGTLHLKQNFIFHIFIEEDLDKFYFTLNKIKLIGCKNIERLIKKYFENVVYKCDENRVTFVLTKQSPKEFCNATTVETVIIEKEEEEEEQIQTYDILDATEITDFEENLLKISSILLLMENSNLDHEEIENLSRYLNTIASILSVTNDAYVISTSLQNLAQSIMENMDYFDENSSMLFEFTQAFVSDLSFWKTKIFEEGATSVDFLNDSIVSNANMLCALLRQVDNTESENLDDIFDF